jgi:hypothetical protein
MCLCQAQAWLSMRTLARLCPVDVRKAKSSAATCSCRLRARCARSAPSGALLAPTLTVTLLVVRAARTVADAVGSWRAGEVQRWRERQCAVGVEADGASAGLTWLPSRSGVANICTLASTTMPASGC